MLASPSSKLRSVPRLVWLVASLLQWVCQAGHCSLTGINLLFGTCCCIGSGGFALPAAAGQFMPGMGVENLGQISGPARSVSTLSESLEKASAHATPGTLPRLGSMPSMDSMEMYAGILTPTPTSSLAKLSLESPVQPRALLVSPGGILVAPKRCVCMYNIIYIYRLYSLESFVCQEHRRLRSARNRMGQGALGLESQGWICHQLLGLLCVMGCWTWLLLLLWQRLGGEGLLLLFWQRLLDLGRQGLLLLLWQRLLGLGHHQLLLLLRQRLLDLGHHQLLLLLRQRLLDLGHHRLLVLLWQRLLVLLWQRLLDLGRHGLLLLLWQRLLVLVWQRLLHLVRRRLLVLLDLGHHWLVWQRLLHLADQGLLLLLRQRLVDLGLHWLLCCFCSSLKVWHELLLLWQRLVDLGRQLWQRLLDLVAKGSCFCSDKGRTWAVDRLLFLVWRKLDLGHQQLLLLLRQRLLDLGHRRLLVLLWQRLLDLGRQGCCLRLREAIWLSIMGPWRGSQPLKLLP